MTWPWKQQQGKKCGNGGHFSRDLSSRRAEGL